MKRTISATSGTFIIWHHLHTWSIRLQASPCTVGTTLSIALALNRPTYSQGGEFGNSWMGALVYFGDPSSWVFDCTSSKYSTYHPEVPSVFQANHACFKKSELEWDPLQTAMWETHLAGRGIEVDSARGAVCRALIDHQSSSGKGSMTA